MKQKINITEITKYAMVFIAFLTVGYTLVWQDIMPETKFWSLLSQMVTAIWGGMMFNVIKSKFEERAQSALGMLLLIIVCTLVIKSVQVPDVLWVSLVAVVTYTFLPRMDRGAN